MEGSYFNIMEYNLELKSYLQLGIHNIFYINKSNFYFI